MRVCHIWKYFKHIGAIFSFAYLFTINALADNGSAGQFMTKAKIVGVIMGYKKTSPIIYTTTLPGKIPTSYSGNNTTSIGNNLGFELSGSYFFNDNIAAEISVGLINKKIKLSGVNLQNNTDSTIVPLSYEINTQAKLIPISSTIQYHLAPYGKISPYIGVGYHYTLGSASKGSKLNNSHGLIGQIGADAKVGNDLFVNLDIKKYIMQNRLSFKVANANGGFDSIPGTKMKINPLMLSLGVGYRF
jgi:outer membrane protein